MKRLISWLGVGLIACGLAACGPDSVARSVRPDSATQTPTPGPVEVKIENLSNYRLEGDTTYFIGEVVNTGQVDAANIEVAISLLGDGGQTLAVSSGGSSTLGRPILKPGERASFQVRVRDAPATWKEERAQVQAKAPSESTRNLYYFDLKSEGVNCTPSGRSSGLTCNGQIVNSGAANTKGIQVAVSAYDGNGKLIDVGNGAASLSEIAAGQSSPFTVTLIGLKDPPARVQVQLFGRPDR